MNINPNPKSTATQIAQIKAALMAGETLTPIDALNRFGCFRLAAQISELVHSQGMDIKREWYTTPTGKKVMSYRMA